MQRIGSTFIGMSVAALLGVSAIGVAAADSTDSSASVGAAISDTVITGEVKSKIAADSRLQGSDVHVETNNGVVTLTGSANSGTAKDAAEELSRNVSGVHSVNDELAAPNAANEVGATVKHAAHRTAEVVTDTTITTKLKTKFDTDGQAKGSHVEVKTDNGVVMLTGTVVSNSQKAHLVRAARATSGVKQVDTSGLTVASE
jgi:hyperosmotically inducible protein